MEVNKPKNCKYFQEAEVARLEKLSQLYRYQQAAAGYIEYLNRFPNDYYAWGRYIDVLIKLGQLDEAEYILDSLELKDNVPESSRQGLLLVKVKLLCCQKKYQECYDLFDKNAIVFYENGWLVKSVSFFLRKKLNKLIPSDNDDSYLTKQIISYSEELALDHLTKHQSIPGNDNEFLFVEGFPLEEVYYQVRELIPNCIGYPSSIIDKKYFFKYDCNGYVYGKMTDYFGVVVLNDSTDIITMFPYKNTGNLSYTDITPIVENKEKKISRVDKFNQKYGLNG